MNSFQTQLYKDLTYLVETSNGDFICKDYVVSKEENSFFRVFTYSLPKQSKFQQPNATNCRGTMFYIENNNVSLVALPMGKFHSFGETPESQKLDYTDALEAYVKEDGSLLTSYIHPVTHTLVFKSKDTPKFLEYTDVEKAISGALFSEIFHLTQSGYSLDLEITTPNNRVIIEYEGHKVFVLSARSLENGEYLNLRSETFKHTYPTISQHLVKQVDPKNININAKDIEGYVVLMPNGKKYKIKTVPYLSMVAAFRFQDSSKEFKNLYAAAVHDVIDEVKNLYYHKYKNKDKDKQDLLVEKIAKIEEIERYAVESFRQLEKRVEDFYQEHKHLERPDYGRMTQTNKDIAKVLMNRYLNNTIDYKKESIKLYGEKKINF